MKPVHSVLTFIPIGKSESGGIAMRSKGIVFLLCLVLVSAGFVNAAGPNDKSLTNQDVISMVKNFLPGKRNPQRHQEQ